MRPIAHPDATEYAPYYSTYISKLPNDADVVSVLERQGPISVRMLGSLDEAAADHRYAPDKWTVREVFGHMIDVERVMTYRALRIARNDATPLPGFDENAWVPAAEFHRVSPADLAKQYGFVRGATVALARSLTPEALARLGSANAKPISARALFWIVAGHERHHLSLFRERYGLAIPD